MTSNGNSNWRMVTVSVDRLVKMMQYVRQGRVSAFETEYLGIIASVAKAGNTNARKMLRGAYYKKYPKWVKPDEGEMRVVGRTHPNDPIVFHRSEQN